MATLNGRAWRHLLRESRVRSRSRRRRSVPLCPFDTGQLPAFYSGEGSEGERGRGAGSGGPFKVLMAHSGKMTLPSLPLALSLRGLARFPSCFAHQVAISIHSDCNLLTMAFLAS